MSQTDSSTVMGAGGLDYKAPACSMLLHAATGAELLHERQQRLAPYLCGLFVHLAVFIHIKDGCLQLRQLLQLKLLLPLLLCGSSKGVLHSTQDGLMLTL